MKGKNDVKGKSLIKRICITGAHGFIGRYAARAFHAAGYEVVGIGHGAWSDEDAAAWGVDAWHRTDVTVDALQTYADGCDAIIHCAGSGSVGFSMSHPMQDFERTVWTTHYVLEYLRMYAKDTVLVYPSSAAVYGTQAVLPLSVDMPLHPISPYGVHKKIVEELCAMYAEIYGVRCIVLRLFSVYGDELRKQLLWDACRKLSHGENLFWGTGEETRDWVHVTDAARAMRMVAERASERCPIVNVASGKAVRIRDILSLLFSSYGVTEAPKFGGQINEGNPQHYVADVQELCSWGWIPDVTLAQGVASYVRWYQSLG